MRLNKYLRDSGLGSRRAVEFLIKSGQVSINGLVVRKPYTAVKEHDVVRFNDRIVKPVKEKRIFIYYKPRGVTTTLKDGHASRTLTQALKLPPGFFPCGRLDRDSEGLLVITNDGKLAYSLTHPSFKVKKGYEVTAREIIERHNINSLLQGVWDKKDFLKPDSVSRTGVHSIFIVIHEGKKREIRRMMKKVRLTIIRLKRVFMGPFELKPEMKAGDIVELPYSDFISSLT